MYMLNLLVIMLLLFNTRVYLIILSQNMEMNVARCDVIQCRDNNEQFNRRQLLLNELAHLRTHVRV
jgi:hypothetical protein